MPARGQPERRTKQRECAASQRNGTEAWIVGGLELTHHLGKTPRQGAKTPRASLPEPALSRHRPFGSISQLRATPVPITARAQLCRPPSRIENTISRAESD